jgi:GT2 family glycosyltransferase
MTIESSGRSPANASSSSEGTRGSLVPVPRARVEPLDRPPTFAIVIRAYQAAATIGEAVRSALGQEHASSEIIVVDDGSTDDIDAALRPFRKQVTLIRKENGGGASALNAGAAAASSDFLAILDADDSYHPRRIQVLAALGTQRPDLDLVTTDARFLVDGEPVGRFSDYNPFDIEDQRVAILDRCFVGGWPAVRLSRLNAVGGFDESLRVGHDWDCWLRLIFAGASAGFVGEPYYDYRLHGGSLTASRRIALWDRVRLLEKARATQTLSAGELSVLSRSLREHRSRAVLAEVDAVLEGRGSSRRLAACAFASGISPRARLRVAMAMGARPLARRRVGKTLTPEDRFRGDA